MKYFSSAPQSKISITGPESTGKTTLAMQLAESFSCSIAPEYARQYLDAGEKVTNSRDILHLAKMQIAAEQEAWTIKDRALICDTDILVLYIWCKEKFHPVPSALEALLHHHTYDVTLLCAPDIPWTEDPWRENPLDRGRLFNEYRSVLKTLKRPYEIIEGDEMTRLNLAKIILKPLMK